jgi:hypothetical protein
VKRSVALVVGVLQLGTACYGYVPVQHSPSVGARVAIEVNDEGRVALREQLGPGVVRVEGRLAGLEGGDYIVDASTVTAIRGPALPLDTVRVRLNQRLIERVDERRLSRRRTWTVVGAALAVVATFLATQGFGSRGTPPEGPPGPPPIDQ